MIDIGQIAARHGKRALFTGSHGTVTYARFARMVDEQAESLAQAGEPGALVPHPLEWSAEAFARMLALLRTGHSVFLGREAPAASLAPFAAHRPLLVLRTGGTTGSPRHVVHSLERLCAPYGLQERPAQRLLVMYAAAHIAGLDAFFQAYSRGGTLVVPESFAPPAVVDAIERHQVQVLPATPTFLNFLLLSGAVQERKLESVTAIPHGAEPMPPALRERIRVVFPHARLIHRFGLTELGALPVRADPDDPDALFLEGEGYAWKVEDGQLWIRCPTRMLGTLEEGPVDPAIEWHQTGDLAEATPRGSVRVLGRRQSLINVGGEKVLPETIEALLLEQPGVRDAAVRGVPSPLTGQAVAAEVVFAGNPDPIGLMRALRVAVRAKGLSLAHVPTRVDPVDAIGATAAGKRDRGSVKA